VGLSGPQNRTDPQAAARGEDRGGHGLGTRLPAGVGSLLDSRSGAGHQDDDLPGLVERHGRRHVTRVDVSAVEPQTSYRP